MGSSSNASSPTLAGRIHDVCIVGAGPAGATTAYLLARQGLSVALVDRARFPRDKTCGDGITPRGARVLARIGALAAVEAAGFGCKGVDVRGPGTGGRTVEFTMHFGRDRAGGPSDLIVLPRFALDALLLRHALTASPTYLDDTKVVDVRTTPTHAEVVADDGRVIAARVVVLATGAESQLLRACGLLAQKPAVEHAARTYFDGVEGLTDRVVLFFDGVDLPGYGWIFPTSPTSANIGCGAFAQDDAMPQAQRLEKLITTHPMLVRMLAKATRTAPLKAYPLIVVGEAAGLVNPITGEGIDYALESAEFVAAAVARHWPKRATEGMADDEAARITEDYRERLSRRFTRRFALYRAVQRHALAPARTPTLLTRVADAPALQRLVVDGLFGRAKPAHLLRPRTLWEIARLFIRGVPTDTDGRSPSRRLT
jgi:geranylgeranyl reductase family protein